MSKAYNVRLVSTVTGVVRESDGRYFMLLAVSTRAGKPLVLHCIDPELIERQRDEEGAA